MPSPSGTELSRLGDHIGLTDAWSWWCSQQSGSVRIAVSQPAQVPRAAWWRSRWVALTILAVSALASALVVRAQLRPATEAASVPTSAEPTSEPVWSPVSDVTLARVNGMLLSLGQTSASMSVPLAASDLASLVFRSSLRRRPPALADADARLDSLLWIRGTVAGPSGAPVRIEIGGDVRVTRPGAAELVVLSMRMTDVASGTAPAQSPSLPRIRFSIPRFVSEIRIAGGQAMVTTRQW